MNMMAVEEPRSRYQNCIDASKRVRWDIEADVIRGRTFQPSEKFLPDGLTLLAGADNLTVQEQTFLSQIQGRTYANVFRMAERFVNAKILEMTSDHWLTDQTALEALIRFSDEEIKHQALFKRVDTLCADTMPAGYTFDWDPNDVADVVLSKSTWAVLALTLHIELFTQTHYRQSIDRDPSVSELYRDVFKYHWMEESQHALIDEMELRRVDATTGHVDRDRAVDEFIELVHAVDGILQGQAVSDADYFANATERSLAPGEHEQVSEQILRAYRWQYVRSGIEHTRFNMVMGELLTGRQMMRIQDAAEHLR